MGFPLFFSFPTCPIDFHPVIDECAPGLYPDEGVLGCRPFKIFKIPRIACCSNTSISLIPSLSPLGSPTLSSIA